MFTVALLLLSLDLSQANAIPDPSVLLQQVFTLLTPNETALLHNSTQDQCISINDMYNVQTWKDQYNSNPAFAKLLHDQQALVQLSCTEMNLTSNACLQDCQYYNNVLGWIAVLISGNDTEIAKLLPYYTYYSMGAALFSYYDAGNPDMCTYNAGTYCYTPAIANGFPVQQHACCLPGSCVGDDALKVLHSNDFCYNSYAEIFNNLNIPVLDICEPIPRDINQAGPVIVISVFCLFVFGVIIASLWKQYMMEDHHRRSKMNINMDLQPLDNEPKGNLFVSSFNIQDIWKSFKSVRPKGKTQYNFLDGIRVWSMSWVIFGHSFLFWMTAGSSNVSTLIPGFGTPPQDPDYKYVIQEFYMTFAEYAFYSVDSFFFLSGFLAAFSIWRQLSKYKGNKAWRLCYLWIPLSYLSRLLRIVPMMMYTTAIQWQLSDQLSGGYHVTSRDTYTDYCNADWYKILFFYANLEVTSNGETEALACMGHLWYIQCDMQMFLFLPWILLLFAVNKVYGICASFIPILVCVIIRIYYAFHYDFVANQLYPAYPAKNGGSQQNDSYFQPWTRMSVYFIGVMAMLIIITIDDKIKNFKLHKIMYFALMILSGFIMCCLVFWPYEDVKDAPEKRWSLLSNQIYYALGRPVWGIALAIMAFALKYRDNSDGSKSMIKSFLSLEIYQPLGKLTYLMYLIHLIIFAWWALDLELPAYYDEWNELLLVVTVWFLTAFFSVILWFFMEKPITNLVNAFLKWITGGNKQKKQKKDVLDEHYKVLKGDDSDKGNGYSLYEAKVSNGVHDNDYDQTMPRHSMIEHEHDHDSIEIEQNEEK